MGRTRVTSIAASPSLVGAITALIATVAVFLAYNANNGLPFVPTYRVSAILDNGYRLTANNDVRLGGNLIGAIESIETVQLDDGSAGAKLNMRLDKTVAPLPASTRVAVRQKSTFGLKYIDLRRGSAAGGTFDEGAIIPLSNAQVEVVDFDDIYNTFDVETVSNVRLNLQTLSAALAGRGAAINQAVEALAPLARDLKPVMETLGAPRTRLRRFVSEAGDLARTLAPVAEQQADLFTTMADTFAAISADPAKLRETFAETPPTLRAGIDVFPGQRAFLRNATRLTNELRPAARELTRALPALNDAVRVGTPVLERSPELSERLEGTFRSLDALVSAPTTKITINRLGEAVDSLKPTIDHVGPFQTVCNYWNTTWYHLWNHLSEEDPIGTAQRQFVISAPPSEEAHGSLANYSGIPATGQREPDGVFDPDRIPVGRGVAYGLAVKQDLKDNGFDIPDDELDDAMCAAGQTGYALGKQLAPGQRASDPSLNQPYPIEIGTTYTGRARRPR
ncbi:MAG: MlaD family protein [Solirubrobacterales bacterium]